MAAAGAGACRAANSLFRRALYTVFEFTAPSFFSLCAAAADLAPAVPWKVRPDRSKPPPALPALGLPTPPASGGGVRVTFSSAASVSSRPVMSSVEAVLPCDLLPLPLPSHSPPPLPSALKLGDLLPLPLSLPPTLFTLPLLALLTGLTGVTVPIPAWARVMELEALLTCRGGTAVAAGR